MHAQGIDHEPAFNWWVKHMLMKRDKIIASIKKGHTRDLKGSLELGRELPKTVNETYALDAKNGNTFCADAIKKEFENFCVVFKVYQMGR